MQVWQKKMTFIFSVNNRIRSSTESKEGRGGVGALRTETVCNSNLV